MALLEDVDVVVAFWRVGKDVPNPGVVVANRLQDNRPLARPALVLSGRGLLGAVQLPVAAVQAAGTAGKAPVLVERQDGHDIVVRRRAQVARIVLVDDDLDEFLEGGVGGRLQHSDVLIGAVRRLADAKNAQRGDDLLKRMRMGSPGSVHALAELRLVFMSL